MSCLLDEIWPKLIAQHSRCRCKESTFARAGSYQRKNCWLRERSNPSSFAVLLRVFVRPPIASIPHSLFLFFFPHSCRLCTSTTLGRKLAAAMIFCQRLFRLFATPCFEINCSTDSGLIFFLFHRMFLPVGRDFCFPRLWRGNDSEESNWNWIHLKIVHLLSLLIII